MKNHLGKYECKLCLTLHTNEGSYMSHTQGKRHQENLKRRAAKYALKIYTRKPRSNAFLPLYILLSLYAYLSTVNLDSYRLAQREGQFPLVEKKKIQPKKTVKIGRPGYKVVKQKDSENNQRSLLFQVRVKFRVCLGVACAPISALLFSSQCKQHANQHQAKTHTTQQIDPVPADRVWTCSSIPLHERIRAAHRAP